MAGSRESQRRRKASRPPARGRHAIAAGARLQYRLLRGNVRELYLVATTPLYTSLFTLVIRHADRPELAPIVIVAPTLIALWSSALTLAGDIVDDDRYAERIAAQIAAPAPYGLMVLGRVLVIVTASLLGFGGSWATARALGVSVTVHHPGVLVARLACTALAMAGTAVLMATLFVLSRTARSYQNALNYPFYVLGGVLVPVDLLPDWLRPLSRLVFLSYSADVFRASLSPGPIPGVVPRLAMVLLLGAAGLLAGHALLVHVLRRVRMAGTLERA